MKRVGWGHARGRITQKKNRLFLRDSSGKTKCWRERTDYGQSNRGLSGPDFVYQRTCFNDGVRGGTRRFEPIASNAEASRSNVESSYARPAKVRPTGMPMSAMVPIGTVTVGMPKWRQTRLPLATQVPLRQAMCRRRLVDVGSRPGRHRRRRATPRRRCLVHPASPRNRACVVFSSPFRPSSASGYP
jgi:hypothetical protein